MHRNNPRKLLQMMQAIVVWFCSKEIRLPGVKAGTKPRTFLEAIFSLKASTVFFPRLQSHVSKHPSLRQYSVILWFLTGLLFGWKKVKELVAQWSLTLCNSTDHSPPDSSVHRILQARIQDWVAVYFTRDLPDPGIETWVSEVAQSCPTLCNPMDYTVFGILYARILEEVVRILEWVAFPFPRISSQPRDWTQVFHIAGGFFTRWATREAQEYSSG